MKKFSQFLAESGGKNHPSHKADRDLKRVIGKYKIPAKHGWGDVYYGKDRIVIPLHEFPLTAMFDEDYVAPENHPAVQKLINDLESGRFKDPRMTSWGMTEGSAGMNVNQVSMDFANLVITKNPKKLYHWTKTENVDKILDEGLVPTKGNWNIAGGSATYKAVFLCESPSRLSKNPGFKHYKKPKFTQLEIDPQGLKLFVDPAYFSPDPVSYISFDHIPSSQVKVK